MSSKVKVSDFVAASKKYVKKSVTKANKDKNAYLTKAEAKSLPKDLRDNFNTHRKLAQKNERAGAKKFTENFGKYVDVKIRKADSNKDGFIGGSRERRKVPADLRDNLSHYELATTTLARLKTEVSSSRDSLFDKLERGVAEHDWHGLLPMFDKENRVDQFQLGVNDYQYLAEGLGLHMLHNELPGPVTRAETLDRISRIEINRTATETAPDSERYRGTVFVKGGKKLELDLFIKPVSGGFVIDPPVG
jgi:hypothetical protein